MIHKEKYFVVTGAGHGIGKGIARRLIAEGAHVFVAENNADTGLQAIEQLGSKAHFIHMDVSDEGSVRDGFQQMTTITHTLHGLVNNAGIADPAAEPIEQLSLSSWKRILDTNLTGCFLCTRSAVPLLKGQEGAAIVNIASTRTYQSEPNTEAYAASKGGIMALTHALAISLGPKIRVNAVAPGWIDVSEGEMQLTAADHEQHPAGRVGRPEDIAALVSFLLGPESSFIVGQTLIVDGGMTRKMIYV